MPQRMRNATSTSRHVCYIASAMQHIQSRAYIRPIAVCAHTKPLATRAEPPRPHELIGPNAIEVCAEATATTEPPNHGGSSWPQHHSEAGAEVPRSNCNHGVVERRHGPDARATGALDDDPVARRAVCDVAFVRDCENLAVIVHGDKLQDFANFAITFDEVSSCVSVRSL